MKTIDYYLNQPEGQTYDKKSGRILPGRVRLNNMRTTHFSRNPKIAAFMKAYEFIREFGEGVDRMYRELEEGGWPKPVFRQDDFMLRASLKSRFVTDDLQKDPNKQTGNQTDSGDALQNTLQNDSNLIQVDLQDGVLNEIVKNGIGLSQVVTSLSQALSQAVPSSSPVRPQLKDSHFSQMSMVMLQLQSQQCSISELMKVVGEKNKNRFRQFVLRPLINIGLVETTIKDVPNSPKQRYALTEKGKELMKSYEI